MLQATRPRAKRRSDPRRLTDPAARPTRRAVFVCKGALTARAAGARTAFQPPKAKAFDRQALDMASRDELGTTSSAHSGSGSS